MNADERRRDRPVRDEQDDRLAAEVSEQLNRALGHLDIYSVGDLGGMRHKRKSRGATATPEPRFGARRPGKGSRPPADQSQRHFDFDSEVHQ